MLTDAIAFHHEPENSKEGRALAYAVHLADYTIMAMGIGIGRDGLQYCLDPSAIEYYGFNDTTLDQLTDIIPEFIESSSIMIRAVSVKNA